MDYLAKSTLDSVMLGCTCGPKFTSVRNVLTRIFSILSPTKLTIFIKQQLQSGHDGKG